MFMANYSVCGVDCELYRCNSEKKQAHCGKCNQFPCDKLKEWASKENPEKIDNLKGLISYI